VSSTLPDAWEKVRQENEQSHGEEKPLIEQERGDLLEYDQPASRCSSVFQGGGLRFWAGYSDWRSYRFERLHLDYNDIVGIHLAFELHLFVPRVLVGYRLVVDSADDKDALILYEYISKGR